MPWALFGTACTKTSAEWCLLTNAVLSSVDEKQRRWTQVDFHDCVQARQWHAGIQGSIPKPRRKVMPRRPSSDLNIPTLCPLRLRSRPQTLSPPVLYTPDESVTPQRKLRTVKL